MKNFIYNLFVLFTSLVYFTVIESMEKKKHPEARSYILSNIIKNYCVHEGYTTKVQIIVDENKIKNRGGLQEGWQSIFNTVQIEGILHRDDQALLAQVDLTVPTIKLKKIFKPQFRSKTLRQIQMGKITAPPLKPSPSTPQKRNLLYNCVYAFTLLSVGWFGKEWWDDGGKEIALNWSSYLITEFIDLINDGR